KPPLFDLDMTRPVASILGRSAPLCKLLAPIYRIKALALAAFCRAWWGWIRVLLLIHALVLAKTGIVAYGQLCDALHTASSRDRGFCTVGKGIKPTPH